MTNEIYVICKMRNHCNHYECKHRVSHLKTDEPECIGIDGYQCPGCYPTEKPQSYIQYICPDANKWICDMSNCPHTKPHFELKKCKTLGCLEC